MKLVIVKHFSSNEKYLFAVPDKESVYASRVVLCDTEHGDQYGLAVCDSFRVDEDDELDVLFKAFKTDKKSLRYIKGSSWMNIWKTEAESV